MIDVLGTVIRFAYELRDRIAIIDARGNTRSCAYDAANRLTSEAYVLFQTTSYQYDRAGRQIVRDDPRGATYDVFYGYNGVNRTTSITSTELAAPIGLSYMMRWGGG